MAKGEKTSKNVATKASKVLRSKQPTKAQKSVAASILTQKKSTGFIIGRKGFESISAVEGVYLSKMLRDDLRQLEGSSPEKRRLVLTQKYAKK